MPHRIPFYNLLMKTNICNKILRVRQEFVIVICNKNYLVVYQFEIGLVITDKVSSLAFSVASTIAVRK